MEIRLSELELAWLAGLLEGEGSFVLAPPSDPTRPRISLQMTDEDVVRRVATMFKLTYVQSRRYEKKVNWKQSFCVILRGQRAVSLMKRLYPYMGERRKKRITEIISSYKERPAAVAKLSDKAVRDIRTKRISMRQFAEFYGVAKGTIQRVQEGKYYKRVK